MGIALVQQIGGTSGSTSGQTSLTSTATTFTNGNLLVAVVTWSTSGAGTPSIATPSGWSGGTSLHNTAINGVAWFGYIPNNPGGSQSWTWTLTPGGQTPLEWAWTIFEFSGVVATSPLDLAFVDNATGASSTTINSGAASGTTAAGDLLLQLVGFQHGAAIAFSSSVSSVPSTGWTVATTYESTGTSPYAGVAAQYQILSGTATNPDGVLTASVTTSYESALFTFLAASGGSIVSGSASEQANAALADSANTLIASGDVLQADASLVASGIVVAYSDVEQANATLSDAPAQLVALATLQASASLGATGSQLGANDLIGNAALVVNGQVIASSQVLLATAALGEASGAQLRAVGQLLQADAALTLAVGDVVGGVALAQGDAVLSATGTAQPVVAAVIGSCVVADAALGSVTLADQLLPGSVVLSDVALTGSVTLADLVAELVGV
jgi:hypothetical protein